jgi:PAS domain S-box-containing protein
VHDAPRDTGAEAVAAVTGVPTRLTAGAPDAPGRPAAVITMDCAGAIVEFSPAAERMFGYTRAEVLGQPLGDLLVPVRLRAAHEAGVRRFRETGASAFVDRHIRVPVLGRDGREVEVDMVVSRVRHDGAEAFVAFLREIDGPTVVPADLLLRLDFFRNLVEHTPNLVAVLDEAGHATYASPAGVAMFGLAEGKGFVDALAHPDDRADAQRAIDRAGGEGPSEPVEVRLRDRDGTWRAVSALARDLRSEPAITGTALYATDASRVRAAERRERVEYTRLMTLVESLNVGVLLQDENRRVVITNSAFVELFDVGQEAAARAGGRGNAALFADAAAAYDRADEVISRGRPLFGDEVTLVDGRVLEREYVPITLDGSTLGHLWVFHDVTAKAEARRTLQERNRILTELSALKTEFVAVLSHELRTPLTTIATFADMLDGPGDLDPTEYRSAVGAIRRNAERMLSLVADLVHLARLESGELTLDAVPVDLPRLLSEVVPDGVAHDLPDGPPVVGDAELLRQLIDTVFSVIRGITARLEVTATVTDEAWVVRADALTTEPATTERLLSTRLPHPRYPGEHRTGALALVLARAIAARHGGNLSTTVGPSSVTITVTLPITPPDNSG